MSEEGMTAKRYEVRSLADFISAIPHDRLDDCLKDFALWCALHHTARKLMGDLVTVRADGFVWIDDGAHDAHMIFKAGDEEIGRVVVEAGP